MLRPSGGCLQDRLYAFGPFLADPANGALHHDGAAVALAWADRFVASVRELTRADLPIAQNRARATVVPPAPVAGFRISSRSVLMAAAASAVLAVTSLVLSARFGATTSDSQSLAYRSDRSGNLGEGEAKKDG